MWDKGADLASWVDNWADHQPASLAIEFKGVETNYDQLSTRISAIASWLHSQSVGVGDRVAWLGPNQPLAIELLFACSRLGAIFLPLNSRLLVSEHSWILQDAKPKLVVSNESFLAHAEEAATVIPVYSSD